MDLGWYKPGMTQRGVAKKHKLNRGDIFLAKSDNSLVRINAFRVKKKHAKLGDCLGQPTYHSFRHVADNKFHLVTRHSYDFLERDHRFVRPANIRVTSGSLTSQKKLEVELDVQDYLARTSSTSDMDLYNDDTNQQVMYYVLLYGTNLFLKAYMYCIRKCH